jgi:hypothetical protein
LYEVSIVLSKQSGIEAVTKANENEDDNEWKTMCNGAAVAYIKGTLPSFG